MEWLLYGPLIFVGALAWRYCDERVRCFAQTRNRYELTKLLSHDEGLKHLGYRRRSNAESAREV